MVFSPTILRKERVTGMNHFKISCPLPHLKAKWMNPHFPLFQVSKPPQPCIKSSPNAEKCQVTNSQQIIYLTFPLKGHKNYIAKDTNNLPAVKCNQTGHLVFILLFYCMGHFWPFHPLGPSDCFVLVVFVSSPCSFCCERLECISPQALFSLPIL